MFSLDTDKMLLFFFYGLIKTCIESIENEFHNKQLQK